MRIKNGSSMEARSFHMVATVSLLVTTAALHYRSVKITIMAMVETAAKIMMTMTTPMWVKMRTPILMALTVASRQKLWNATRNARKVRRNPAATANAKGARGLQTLVA